MVVAITAATPCDEDPANASAKARDDSNRSSGFDVRARATVATVIRTDRSIPRVPRLPAILNVQVFADGNPGEVSIRVPSDVPEFTIQAIQHAKGLRYEPAIKNGQRVMSWVQVPFYAQQ